MPILKNNKLVLTQGEKGKVESDVDFLLESLNITKPPIPVGFVIVNAIPSSKIDYFSSMPKELKGCAWAGHNDYRIIINSDYPGCCQRFSLGHELGHLLCNESGASANSNSIKLNSRSFSDYQERRANYYAACLLMPEKMIREFWRWFPNENKMASIFEVSRQAMIIRLKWLGLLPYDVAEQLLLAYSNYSF